MCHICRRLGIEQKTLLLSSLSETEDEDLQQNQVEEDEAEADANLKEEGKTPEKQVAGYLVPDSTVLVETAPSHDGAPTFAAYWVFVTLLDSANSKSPPSKNPEKHRPPFGIRI